jgi:pimeloyl-ACP methyl ester carboxylesterase
MRRQTIYKSDKGRTIIAQYYEKYLESLEEQFERTYVETTFGRTHVLIAGPKEGKPIFIFQGGNCINPLTLSWFSALSKDYRIYAPDTIGHPGFSDENRISAQDNSFARWISELMSEFRVEKAGFIGPSYGGGIFLRLAAFMPEKIACSVLVAPAGIKLGSKMKMIQKILVPLVMFKVNQSKKQLDKITDILSDYSMKELDREIIGNVFQYVKLDSEMPKLTEKIELENYHAPTLVISGSKDIFFPERNIRRTAHEIIPNLIGFETFEMGHFPSEGHLTQINGVIKDFLNKYY